MIIKNYRDLAHRIFRFLIFSRVLPHSPQRLWKGFGPGLGHQNKLASTAVADPERRRRSVMFTRPRSVRLRSLHSGSLHITSLFSPGFQLER